MNVKLQEDYTMGINVFNERKNILYRRKMPSKAVILAALFCMVFSLAGCSLAPKEEEVLAPILKEPPKVVFNTIEVKTSTFEIKKEVTGTMVSTYQKDLSFQNSSGRLKSLNVTVGDKVKKGELLAELLTADLGTQIKEQELLLKQAQLALETLKLNGQKDLDILELQLDSLKLNLKNMNSISDAYSKEEIKVLKEQIQEKEISYKNSVETQKNNIKVSENSIALCQLKLDTLRQNLKDTRIISPIDGVITFITNIQVGSNIDAFDTVVSISDPNALQVLCSVGSDSPFLLGMKVNVKLKDFETTGEVVMTPAEAPSDADEFIKSTIRVKLDKITPDIVFGDYAQITLIQMKKENAIVIDTNLIRNAGERKFVNVLEDGIKKEIDIEIGANNQTQTVVEKGLSVGDLIIK